MQRVPVQVTARGYSERSLRPLCGNNLPGYADEILARARGYAIYSELAAIGPHADRTSLVS